MFLLLCAQSPFTHTTELTCALEEALFLLCEMCVIVACPCEWVHVESLCMWVKSWAAMCVWGHVMSRLHECDDCMNSCGGSPYVGLSHRALRQDHFVRGWSLRWWWPCWQTRAVLARVHDSAGCMHFITTHDTAEHSLVMSPSSFVTWMSMSVRHHVLMHRAEGGCVTRMCAMKMSHMRMMHV